MRSLEQQSITNKQRELVAQLKKQHPNATVSDLSNISGIPWSTLSRRLQELSHLSATSENMGTQIENVQYGWLKSDEASFFFKNPLYEEPTVQSAIADAIADLKKYSPKYPVIKRKELKDPCALIFNVTDLHIGGETEKAKQRALEGLEDIMTRASHYPIDKIYFVGGNDIIQIDTPLRTTTKGTPIPSDISWHEMFREARDLYIEMLERLRTIAPIHYLHVLSNHDEVLGFTLSQLMKAWFRNSDITFDVTHEERKYMKYGNNFLGFTHGHGAKDDQLPALAAHEAAKIWGETKHRYIYCGHIHHRRAIKFKSGKDYTGLNLEWLRSSTDPNDYEKRMGFITPAGITSFIHDKKDGQIARLDKNF